MTFEYTNPVKCTKQEAWNLIADLERRPDSVLIFRRNVTGQTKKTVW